MFRNNGKIERWKIDFKRTVLFDNRYFLSLVTIEAYNCSLADAYVCR